MRDPTVNAETAAAIAEAVKAFSFYKDSWLKPTTIDWSDVDRRQAAELCVTRLPDFLMPADLRDLIVARLRENKRLPRGPGRHCKGEFGPRDVVIVSVIKQLMRQGFHATRNREPKNTESACSETACAIVRAALAQLGLHLEEDTIEKIWSKRRRI